MKNQLSISEEAYWDMADAIEYYKCMASKKVIEKFRTDLSEGMHYIKENPERLAVKYKGIRVFNLKNFPCQIHFLLEENIVMIFRVYHGRSNPKSWEDRLTK